MAPVVLQATERREERRCSGAGPRWKPEAVLRPGQPVIVVNISNRAALVEAGARLRPGSQTEIQLAASGTRLSIRGRLDRCYVVALNPIRFRGLLVFERPVELEAGIDTRHE